MHGGACKRAPQSFKYKIAWERDSGLTPVVEHARACTARESALDIRNELRSLSTDLSTWDRTHFGNMRQEIQCLNRELQEMCKIPNRSRPLHAELKLIERLTELYHWEEILWRQRARSEWLTHGDKNTYFFHLRGRRRRKNQIKSLQLPSGQMTDNLTEMENLTNDFYQQLYTSEGV